MKNKRDDARKNEVRVELKYCERCGALWMRECGSGLIYCNGCQPDVTELPILKKRPQSVKLGIGQRAAIDEYSFDACAAKLDRPRGRGGVA
ncbi:MAG TPA: hypothetical protein VIH89_04185 [Candidatus Sulfotelmatobacter sp.]|jgi:hypothetical protein